MKRGVIGTVPLLAALPAAELDALEATLAQSRYAAGTILFREDDVGDRFYIVLEGCIAILKAMGAADERLVAERGAGEFVGEMSLLNVDGRRTASARVDQDALVLELTRHDFDALLHRFPSLAYAMLRILSTRLRDSHDRAIGEMHEKNERLARAYAELQAAQAQIIEQQTLERELRLAREIQESMLPPALPRLAGLDIGARMVPARSVGGDFYDVIALGPETLGIAIGDVSGKGIPAALFMALTSSLLRAEAMRGAAPHDVLQHVNRQIRGRNARGMFVTVLYGVLNMPARELTFVRAGHDLPLVWDASGRPRPLILGCGQPLGLFSDPRLDLQRIALSPGDLLLLYTDGVTEARDPEDQFFGLEGLKRGVRARRAARAQEICDYLTNVLAEYQGRAPQSDDITLLSLRVD